MSYQDQLRPWAVYRRLPNLQRLLMERFRQRHHAEEYLKVVQRLQPQWQLEIVYEVPDSAELSQPDRSPFAASSDKIRWSCS